LAGAFAAAVLILAAFALLGAEDGRASAGSRPPGPNHAALARSIEALEPVDKAYVHIAPTSAAVTVSTSGPLSRAQIEAIRYLVASAAPGLSPESVSIVDDSGTLLARAVKVGAAGDLDARQQALQSRIAAKIETMLGAVVGADNVRAEVAVELDPDQVRRETQTYDPDLQVVQRTASAETAAPGEETVYQNSSTKTTLTRRAGEVKRLTVSVLVDGTYAGPDAKSGYAPRTPAEIERLTRLVENAIGYDELRGDSVVVESVRFAEASSQGGGTKGLLPLARTALLGLIGIAALFVLARAVDWRSLLRAPKPQRAEVSPSAEVATAELTRLRDRQGIDQEIDRAQVEGQLRASALRKVGEIIEAQPAESAAVVRQWMYS
jgi:flagellar M-ring protein FliF